SFSIGTPAEIALKSENKALKEQLLATQTTINSLNNQVDQLAQTDNSLYRSMLGMPKKSIDERKGGFGGADMYSDFDIYSEKTADILKETAKSLESLEQSIDIQKNSFKKIKSYYHKNIDRMSHLPAIKPVNGGIISGFGQRFHPILKYNREHSGIDLEADVGSKVYAAADGIVTNASRDGSYGRLIIVDHGYGFKTYYAHLSAYAKDINSGTRVKRGEVIAYSGQSGLATGPHVHYEVHRDGEAVNPLHFLIGDVTPQQYLRLKEQAESSKISMD